MTGLAVSADTSPTRIAFCITELDPGGAERALYQLVTRLPRQHWEPRVYCLAGEGDVAGELRAAGIPVHAMGARHRRNWGVVGRLAAELRTFRPELLQTFLFHANIAGRIAARWAGVPKVVSGIRVAERRSRWRLRIDRITERWVDRHVCVSDAVAQYSIAVGRLCAEKTVVIPNGVDYHRFAEAVGGDLSHFGIPPNATTALFVGRLDPQKAPFVLLEAVKGLLPVYPQLHVLLIGDGPLRGGIERWIAGHAAAERVHLGGWVPEVAPILSAADMLVLPSQWEGMPNVLLEAMAAGLPVISTAVEGTSELIHNHRTGLLVPPNAPRELAGAISLLMSDANQAQTLAKNAQLLVKKQFTWNRTASSFESLYEELLSETG